MSDTETKKEKKSPKNPNQKKYSNFLITINPNVHMDKGDSEFKTYFKCFKEALDNIFDKDHILDYIIIKKQNDTVSKIKTIKSNYTAEIGDNMHVLHGHCLLEIRHFTCIKLDYQKIRDVVKNSLKDYVNKDNEIHLDVQVIRSTNRKTIIDYIKKKELKIN
jgi:hypothetical protein